ncbi:MAG: CBS domain-containing protein [Lachnospiraceae bacterium]|nr:CBS domain-containing protein [Lachnospiraceae bacterium]MDD3795521.1 CBS domain-containing protein [Lachnospiraceae bacterium]
MNILFYLIPKNDLVYVYDDSSIHQAMEKMEYHRFTSIPVINRKGNYVGSLTEGDILWGLKERGMDQHLDTDELLVRQLKRCRDNDPVNINCNIEDLVMTAMHQNFIPVIDDNAIFIGIVTRKSIIAHCFEQYRKVQNAEK